MKSRKLLMILNPRAGKNKSRGPLFDAAAVLSQAGWLLSIHVTSAPGDAAETARREGGHYDLVVAVGGAGRLNHTFHKSITGASVPVPVMAMFSQSSAYTSGE